MGEPTFEIKELRKVESEEGFGETFVFQQVKPDGVEETLLMGGIFLGSKEDAQWIINMLASLLRREYFQSSDANTARFRRALKKTNEAVSEIRQSRVSLWPGPITFFAAAFWSNHLMLATTGGARALLLRGSAIHDLTKGASAKNGNAFDSFTAITEGICEPHDTLLLIAGLANDQEAIDTLMENARRNKTRGVPHDARTGGTPRVWNDSGKRSSPPFIPQNAHVAVGFHLMMRPKEPQRNETGGSPGDARTGGAPRVWAARVAARSLLVNSLLLVPRLLRLAFSGPIGALYRIPFLRLFLLLLRTALFLFLRPLSLTAGILIRLLQRAAALFGLRSTASQTSTRVWQLRALRLRWVQATMLLAPLSLFRRFMPSASWLPFRASTALSAGKMLLAGTALAAVIGIGFVLQNSSPQNRSLPSGITGLFHGKETQKPQAQQDLTKAEELFGQIERANIYGDEARVQLLLAEIGQLLDSRSVPPQEELREKRDQLSQRLANTRNEILLVEELRKPERLVNFSRMAVSLTPFSFWTLMLPEATNTFYFVDAAQNGIYRYDAATGQGKFTVDDPGAAGLERITAFPQNPYSLFAANTQGIRVFDAEHEEITHEIPFFEKEKPETLMGLTVLDDGVYLLVKASGRNELRRYAIGQNGMPAQTTTVWFRQAAQGALGNAADITSAGGAFFAASNSGQIVKLAKNKIVGSVQLKLPGTESTEGITRIRSCACPKPDTLLLLDSAQGRILVTEGLSGAVKRQLAHPLLAQAKDFLIAEQEKKLYVLTDTEVLAFPLPE